MDSGRDEQIRIKELLKANPKGLSLSDISRLVSMNRHSVAKYMEMLTISGQVEMRTFGPSKVYYLSQRVPISAMLSFSSDIIATIDRDMKIIQVNDSFLKFFGYRLEDLLGQNIREIDRLPMNSGMIRLIIDALEGKAHQYNIRLQMDKDIRYIKMKLIPTVFDDGTPGVVLIGEDITAEKQAEQALKASKQMLEKLVLERTAELTRNERFTSTLISNLPGMVFRCRNDEEWTMEYLSDGCCDLTGYQPDDLLHSRVIAYNKLIYRDDKKKVRDEINHALRENRPYQITYRIITAAGNEKWVWEQGRKVEDRDGVMLEGFITDITAAKATEQRLTETTKLLQAALQASPQAINALDLDTNVIIWNRMAEKVFGWTEGEVLGRPLPTLPDDSEQEREQLRALINSGHRLSGVRICRRRKDGAMIDLILLSAPLYDENGKLIGALGVFKEIG